MKAKSFTNYLERRLDKEEIVEIEKQAQIEIEALESLQKDVDNTQKHA